MKGCNLGLQRSQCGIREFEVTIRPVHGPGGPRAGPGLKIDLTKWAGLGRVMFNGPGQKSLDCIHDGMRLSINVSTVTQRSAV